MKTATAILMVWILTWTTGVTAQKMATSQPVDPTLLRTIAENETPPTQLVTIKFSGWVGMTPQTVTNIIDSAPENVITPQQKKALLKEAKEIRLGMPDDLGDVAGGVVNYSLDLRFDTSAPAEKLAQAFMQAYALWLKEKGPQFTKEQFEAAKARPAKELAPAKVGLEQRRKDAAVLGLKIEEDGISLQDESEITPIIDQLKVKLLELKVDVAGVQARMEAAKGLRSKVDSASLPQVDMLIATAQIELTDLLKRQELIAAMFDAAKRIKHGEGINELERLQHSYWSLSNWKHAMENNLKPTADFKIEVK